MRRLDKNVILTSPSASDTHVYDWWQLFTTLRPLPHPDAQRWIGELCDKYEIHSLPRKVMQAGKDDEKNAAPYVLDRALDGESFWHVLDKRPLVGRCDDHTPGGGGREFEEEGDQRVKGAL